MLTRRVEPIDGWNQTLSRSIFDENNGEFWPNPAFSHDCMDAQQ